nr:copia protein [Tanacetum cinerariifolium]
MKSRFEMSMMGEMTFFLGLQVNQSPCGIFINESNYVLEILKKYGMESCDPVGTPMEIKDKLDLYQNGTLVDATKYRSMIGALMYLTSSRPDIVHATCLCARYQAKPTEKHLKEVKRIFRYLWETVNTCLWYTKDSGFELTGFSDADYAGCKDSFKSTSGGAQFLGEKLVRWSSKKQDCTVLSTTEAEYVSLSACCAQVLWMQTQLTNYGFHFDKIPIYCDSKSAIAISCNPVQHSRTKHIAVRYHFIKEHVEKGTIELYFVKMDYQLADIFTKALPAYRFNYLVRRLGMRSLSSKELERLAKSQISSSSSSHFLLGFHMIFVVMEMMTLTTFVRFIKVFNLDRLVENLCTIWIGSFHLFANKVRFKRPHKPNKTPNANLRAPSRIPKPSIPQHLNSQVGSYANIVNGVSLVMQGSAISTLPALVFDDTCLVDHDLSNQAIGKVKYFSSIPKLYTILNDDGFSDVKLSSLGGLWVLFEFNKMATKVNMMNQTGVNSWFQVIQEACNDFVSNERIFWVDIEGVPLNAWSCGTFTRIGKKWGETLDLEDNTNTSFGHKSK